MTYVEWQFRFSYISHITIVTSYSPKLLVPSNLHKYHFFLQKSVFLKHVVLVIHQERLESEKQFDHPLCTPIVCFGNALNDYIS